MFEFTVTAFSTQSITANVFNGSDPDFDDAGTMPEHRLWIACIIDTVTEYENLIRNAALEFKTGGIPVSKEKKWRINEAFHVAQGKGFRTICSYANFAHYRVIRKMLEIEKRFELGKILWI